MKYLSYLLPLAPLIILVLLRFVFKKKPTIISDITEDKIENNIIKQPKFYTVVMICCNIFFIVIISTMLLMPQEKTINSFEERIALAIIFGIVFLLPTTLLLLFSILWKVVIFEDYFTYRNMFGRKKTFPFKGTEFKILSASVRFYRNGKRILMISPL